MHYEDILVTSERGVGTISIHRPAANNAVRAITMDEIAQAVGQFRVDPLISAIVLTSTGKHFVTGADFVFLQELAITPALSIKDRIYSSFQGAARALYSCPKPTLAAFSGAAVTVGCELALACDFRLVSDTAFFQESWIKLGLIPPLGGLMLLPRIIGIGPASEMILRGTAIRAEEALALRLVSAVVAAADLTQRATSFALELAALAPRAYAAAKEGLHRGLESTMENEWSANALAQSLLLGSEDFREGLNAVMAKRPALFSGR
jgi:enoyl-CoA hydratase/carnithine racemase